MMRIIFVESHMLTFKKLSYAISVLLLSVSTAYASTQPLSTKEVETIIKKSQINPEFQIAAKPEVVSELNLIRRTSYRRAALNAAFKRMKQNEALFQTELKKYHMPNELLAIPIIESGYQSISGRRAVNHPAGIWQMVPGTARRFGLVVNGKRDDRYNIALSTTAAFKYLNKMHAQFGNWMLAVLAYQYGERKIHWLVKKVGSKDVWVLAHSSSAPKNFKRMISLFDADVIILKNPSLVS